MNKKSMIEWIFSVVDKEYPDVDLDKYQNLSNHQKEKIYKIAERNGLSYLYYQKLKEMDLDLSFLDQKNIIKNSNKQDDFQQTIILINEIFNEKNLNYLLIKLLNSIPHVPNDIDILLNKTDRKEIINILEKRGLKHLQSSSAETKLSGSIFDIDLYTEINYLGIEFIDEKFLFRSQAKKKFLNVNYTGLNDNADLLLLLPHSIFGHRRITMLDFLHIKNLLKRANIEKCRAYACENGWGKVFDLMINEINSIKTEIYTNNNVFNFPYIFKRKFILNCIFKLDNFDKSNLNLFFYISFYLEEIAYKLEDTPIYSFLKHFGPLRHLINSIYSFFKTKRGDLKSVDK